MWPLLGRDIARACGAPDVAPAIESVSIAGVAFAADDAHDDEMFVALRDGEWDGHLEVETALAGGAPIALVSRDWHGLARLAPEMRARCLVVDDSVAAFRRLAGELRRGFSFPVVAIGGSNGKTTTKEMIATLLGGPGRHVTKTPETMNGWTGIPLTLALRAHTRAAPPDALVVEIGIDAIGAMEEHARIVDPDVVVITAIGAEHLAGLGDVETAIAEELKLFTSRERARRIILGSDPRMANAFPLATTREGDIFVTSTKGAEGAEGAAGRALVYEASNVDVALSWRGWHGSVRVPMAGAHNAANFALAFAAGLALGRTPDDLVVAFESFVPPTMRCQVHDLSNGTVLIDDAYNANPSSYGAAFALLDSPEWKAKKKVLVLGDMLDLGTASAELHLTLVDRIAELARERAHVFLFGDAMLAVQRALGERGLHVAHLPKAADVRAFIDDAAFASLDDAVVLVKGSRGMHLERFVDELVRRADDPLTKAVTTEADVLRFHGRFQSACITGTNGKTTTTSLVAAIASAAGELSCRVTTLGAWLGDEKVESEPSGPAFVRTLARAAKRDVRTISVETTSHALANGFARTWPARVAVFTNFSRDHLDYHGTPEDYLAAKAQLFMGLEPGTFAVLNVADPASALIDEITPPEVVRLGYAACAPDPACAAIPIVLAALPEDVVVDENGTHGRLAPSSLADALGGRLDLALVGSMHMENALAAACAGHALGYSADAIRNGISSFTGVAGRFEVVHRRPLVVVDYAHTPDALVRTLAVARSLVAARQGSVICVFGCGGERDPGKRSEMGLVAAKASDVVFVTNDNPRSEDPELIADAIEEGARKGTAPVRRILDRESAIRGAVQLSRPGDIVVIAGKGHEKTQVIGDAEIPFDDVLVARKAAMEGYSAR